jgi:hypothetical protein
MTAAERRIMSAHRRYANTRWSRVLLYDANGNPIGSAHRRTCDRLIAVGLLDEDQSKLGDDGHGDFEYVLVKAVQS